MADLRANYMGLELSSPIVVAASSISSRVERIQMAERAGAGALVIRSLFEEQVQFDKLRLEDSLAVDTDLALNPGVHTGRGVAKAVLAGASVVQIASALLTHGIPYLSTMLRELEG